METSNYFHVMMIYDVKDDLILQDSSEEPSMSSKYDSLDVTMAKTRQRVAEDGHRPPYICFGNRISCLAFRVQATIELMTMWKKQKLQPQSADHHVEEAGSRIQSTDYHAKENRK